MNCLICYEQTSPTVFLDCLHSLCRLCLISLRQKVCPFCRAPISREVFEPRISATTLYDLYEPTVRIKFRRRRHAVHITTERLDNVIIEEPIVKRKHRRGDNHNRRNWVEARIHGRYLPKYS